MRSIRSPVVYDKPWSIANRHITAIDTTCHKQLTAPRESNDTSHGIQAQYEID